MTTAEEDIPVWKFDKVKIKQIKPVFKNHNKVHDRCYLVIDFGFFIVHDIGVSVHTTEKNPDDVQLTWSQDFGWSYFKLMDSYIDNPYGDEVRKLEVMVKKELESMADEIHTFMESQSTMPELFLENHEIVNEGVDN